jgi:Family of unknown function (DUF5677)
VQTTGQETFDRAVSSESASPVRAIGHELLEATSRLDGPLGIGRNVNSGDYVALAFAVRARRLLRGAYALLDGDLPEAANALFRVMAEYLIVGKWVIQGGDERAKAWAIRDLRERRVTLTDVLDNRLIGDEQRNSIQAELAATEDALLTHLGPSAALSKRAARKAGEKFPSLEDMAGDLGLEFVYSFAYRLLSQTDVHATALAVDAVYEDDVGHGDPGRRLRAAPRHAMQGFDPYQSGAHVLVDILVMLSAQMPELGWSATLADFNRRIQIAAAVS